MACKSAGLLGAHFGHSAVQRRLSEADIQSDFNSLCPEM